MVLRVTSSAECQQCSGWPRIGCHKRPCSGVQHAGGPFLVSGDQFDGPRVNVVSGLIFVPTLPETSSNSALGCDTCNAGAGTFTSLSVCDNWNAGARGCCALLLVCVCDNSNIGAGTSTSFGFV